MNPNHKVIEFKSFFNAEYKKRKGFLYSFSHGKDEKAILTCIKYFENQYGDQGFSIMRECLGYYLDSEEEFIVETGHDLMYFCTYPHRWLGLLSENRKKIKTDEVKKEKKVVNKGWYQKAFEDSLARASYNEEEYRNILRDDPKRFMKSFKFFGPILKKVSPLGYQSWREFIIKELGKEKAVSLWKELEEDGIQ